MTILCIDLGNTFTKFALVKDNEILDSARVPTPELLKSTTHWTTFDANAFDGIAFCSVVPKLNEPVLEAIRTKYGQKQIFHLTHENCPGLDIQYYKPEEIGQDRLATAIGAQACFGEPVIVIDMGTAVTFDILTESFGYETSMIAPGLEMMTQYLHEKTAQLPLLDPYALDYDSTINQPTAQAMKAGCALGFTSMVSGMLKGLLAELIARKPEPFQVVLTGGSAAHLIKSELKEASFEANLAPIGLYEAYNRFHA